MTSKKIISVVMILLIFQLIRIQLYWNANCDILGLSTMGLDMVNFMQTLSNIVLPIVILVTLLLNKKRISILVLAGRSLTICVPNIIFGIENSQIGKRDILVIGVSILLTVLLILYAFRKINFEITILSLIACRGVDIIFSGTLSYVLDGIKHITNFFWMNLLYLIASELFFVITVIYCKSNKNNHQS